MQSFPLLRDALKACTDSTDSNLPQDQETKGNRMKVYNNKNSKRSISLRGVHEKRNGTIEVKITHKKKKYHLGSYTLRPDAALGYDEAAQFLKDSDWEVNFASESDHLEARNRELNERGFDRATIISVAEIKQKVYDRLTKVSQPKQKSSNFRGVSVQPSGLFRAQITKKKYYGLGSWLLAADCALAYDKAAEVTRGKKTNLNFTSDCVKRRRGASAMLNHFVLCANESSIMWTTSHVNLRPKLQERAKV